MELFRQRSVNRLRSSPRKLTVATTAPQPTLRWHKRAGLSQDDIAKALEGRATDPKADAAVRFAKLLLEKRGRISDSDFDEVKQAGLSEAEIGEIVAHVAINVFTNYFNIAFETEIDFPAVRTQQAKAA